MKRLFFLIVLLFSSAAFAQKTYIQCGKLIDGIADKPQTEVTIVIEGNLIADIQKGYTNGGSSDKIIDLKNKTVMPGLIDCHVHLESQGSKNSIVEGFTFTDADIAYHAAVYAKRTLMAGFTTVRDLGGTGVNISLRKAVKQGLVDGPRIITAGRAISGSGGHMDPSVGFRDDVFNHKMGPDDGVADGRDELIKAVRLQFKRGSDVIKIASTGGVLDLSEEGSGAQMSIDEIKAVVETAKDYGLRVACHAHGAEGIRRAILGGVTSIEHGTFMNDEDFELAKKYGTYLVPTIIAGKSVADSAKIEGYFPPVIKRKAIEVGTQIQATFGRAYKSGVKIAFGTDAGVYAHGKNAIEFQYMVEAGMPPMEAIKAATANAADLLGMSTKVGSISKGKFADIVAVDGDPLTDIKTMRNIAFVMKDGKTYTNQ
ncbi:metal-dependent hydrolase family protein [Mucilaginibacter ginsenosidivorans]|uniref:Amidohydrolase family protein n=1 Tax=Mucilaginibacter ginsenosidivorans TaxID=398053 RepID=A0A5B8UUV1_9SPHI|nr:amidohydrolase family protein [Mucilaginibacter ginsenosidivorans]QEC62658.1 amidohydrolase family protein [Mucilaginibacter ginsenosidivorans]